MAFSQPQDSPSPRRHASGFTLVEVTLALGIIAFAFVALLALLPAGNVAFRKAIDISTAGQIAQRVIADCQNADFDVLTNASGGLSSPAGFKEGSTLVLPLRYFDEQGREIIPAAPTPTKEEIKYAIYHVNTRVMSVAPLPRNTDRRVRKAETAMGERPPLNALAQITVQIVHNPNGLELKLSTSDPNDKNKPDRNLVADNREAKMQLNIFTYSAMVGRTN